MEKIFKQSVELFGKKRVRKEVKEVRVDTTVQEKNITFPTDRKLTEKVIEHCKRIANEEGIKLKRTYGREIKKLKHQLRFARKPKNMNKLQKNQKRFRRLAFKIYQDMVNQLNPIPMKYKDELDVLYRVLTQKRDDTNKVYSIHEPEVL
jgi:IS5 family transposase